MNTLALSSIPEPSVRAARPLNAITIDVEDYFMVSGFERSVHRDEWLQYPHRFTIGLKKILRILRENNTRGTFFFLGWLVERYPECVLEVAEDGHEIALHGYDHRMLYDLDQATLAADLDRSLEALRRVYSGPILGFRAPSFSLREETLWALPILKSRGIKYDSSIFPFQRRRYGMRRAPRGVYEIIDGLLEVPLSTVSVMGKRFPIAGGGYLRLYPFWVTCAAIRRMNLAGEAAVVYVHPWELDPDQPRIRAEWGNSFRHRINLHKTESRLAQLCGRFSFGTIQEMLGI